jgi:glucose/arabinose dehydrogenase
MLLGRVPAAAFACLVSAALAASCGGGGGGSNDSGGNVVNGSSRIGWDQRSDSESDLVFLHFVIYVDGARTELGDASCSTPAGSAGFPCTATLPSMSAGQHTLALASYVFQGAEVIESAKSAPLTVTVSRSSGSTAGLVSLAADSPPVSVPPPSGVRDVTAADGTELRVQPLTQLDHPSALAISNDGTVFVADREGRVLVVHAGTVVGETALRADGETGIILDLALDPEFARTHHVFAIEAVAGDPPTFRISRFRESGGQLGERAVVFGNVPASPDRPSASLAFGPDGHLYAGLDDGGDSENARRPGSYNGKVLRLNADGTTPGDQAGASPIYASNLHAPRSLAWDASSASLWVADAGAQRAERIRSAGRRGTIITPYRLPLAAGPSSLAVYSGGLIPAFDGSLLIAPAEDAMYVLRATVGASGVVSSTEKLEVSSDAPVRIVKVGSDGAIYVATDSEVLRIRPR